VNCGTPLPSVEGAAAPTPALLPPSGAAGTAAPGTGPGYSYALASAYPTPVPAKKASRRWLWAILVVVIAAVLVVGILAALSLSARPEARFVDIVKTGVVLSSMTFDVTLRTSGASIQADHLHLNIQSLHYGAEYDAVQYYNLDRIPIGSTFTWNVDVRVDPYDVASFTYTFVLEVDGVQNDSRTVV